MDLPARVSAHPSAYVQNTSYNPRRTPSTPARAAAHSPTMRGADADLAQGHLLTGSRLVPNLPSQVLAAQGSPSSQRRRLRSRSRPSFRQGRLDTSSAERGQHCCVSAWRFSRPRFNDEEVCTCPQVSIPQQFFSVPWNTFNRDVLKSLYGFAPISMHCNKSSAVRFPVRIASHPKLHSKTPGRRLNATRQSCATG